MHVLEMFLQLLKHAHVDGIVLLRTVQSDCCQLALLREFTQHIGHLFYHIVYSIRIRIK